MQKNFERPKYSITITDKHLRPFLALFLFGAVLLVALYFAFWGSASTEKFYLSSCLGEWQNPEGAAGQPELDESASIDDFSLDNSALLDSSVASIFCGSSEGEIPSGTVPTGAKLRISLAMVEAPAPEPIIEINEEAISELDGEVLGESTEDVEEPISDEDVVDTEQATEVSSESEVSQTEDVLDSQAEEIKYEEESIQPEAQEEEVKEEVVELKEEESTANTSDSESATESSEPEGAEPVDTEATDTETADEVPAEEGSAEEEVAFYWFTKLAYAQESEISSEDGPVTTEETAEEVPAEEVSSEADAEITEEGEVLGESTEESEEPVLDEEMSDTEQSPEASSELEDFSEESASEGELVTGIFVEDQNDDFVEILYSINGTDWISLGFVNRLNWNDLSYEIPLSDWEEVKNLQINVQGYKTISDQPLVYLDGFEIEVSHKIKAVNSVSTTDFTAKTNGDLTIDSDAENICKVDPFSQEINPGETASYEINLSLSKESPHRIFISSIPEGVTPVFEEIEFISVNETTAQLELHTDEETVLQGSRNFVIFFEEQVSNNKVKRSSCQLNLVVSLDQE